jgi:nitrogen fixation protein NifU and related proteins
MDLRDLYQELILDHGKRPRNFRTLEHPTCSVEGYNPLCGDHFTVHVDVRDGVIQEVAFEGGGCAISTASASMMTQAMKGMPVQDARVLFEKFHHLITGERLSDKALPEEPRLGKLEVLAGVSEFPTRVKCATLAWHTLTAALDKRSEPVTTE